MKSTKANFQKSKKLFLHVFMFFMAATLGFLGVKNLKPSNAIHSAYAGFSAGNIMNDLVMGDYTSMSEADIKNFMKSKNSCNDTNTAKAKNYPNLSYHIENGHFVCLADEKFDGETSYHIIWQAAQDYKINPKVLIVLLEKEQGLITDTWPNSTLQYRSATGYGCPDTAACDSQYYGFKNQVRNAAKFFRKNLDGDPNWINYPVGNNYILYNPDSSCGNSKVNVENRATGALYTYTPYQPNSAALNAEPGVSVNCGAYGNRNFYYYYTKWFGDTHGKELAGTYIPEGTYRLQTTAGLALSFTGTTNGSEAKIVAASATDQLQQFTVTKSGKYYMFKNVASGRYLDVYNNESYDGTKVELWDGNSSCAQKWLLQPFGSGFRLISACSSEASTKSLDVYGDAVSTAGTRVNIWATNDSTAQQWNLVSVGSGIISNGDYNIKSISGKALTSSSEVATSGTTATIWESTTSSAARFNLSRTTDGFYKIKQISSGLFLTVKGAGTASTTPITFANNTSDCSQKWGIEKTGSSYKFISACSGKVLDINNANTNTNYEIVQLYTDNGTNAQKWNITAPATQPVANGTYALDSALGSNLRLDTSAAGVNTAAYRNGGNSQKYTLAYDSATGYYTLLSTNSGKYLAVTNNGAENSKVSSDSSANSCQAKWFLLKATNGYKILSSCSRKVMDISGGTAKSGASIITWSDNGGKNQQWTFSTDIASKQLLSSGTYYINSGVGSNMRLDVNGSSVARDGTNVQIWPANTSNSQRFTLSYNANDDTYTFKNLFANRPLDATGAVAKNGVNAEVWSANTSCAQKWKITSLGNDYYRIASACGTKYVLDVSGNTAKTGTNVLLWETNNGNNQKWKFTKI